MFKSIFLGTTLPTIIVCAISIHCYTHLKFYGLICKLSCVYVLNFGLCLLLGVYTQDVTLLMLISIVLTIIIFTLANVK